MLGKYLKVSILENDTAWHDKQANIASVEQALRQLPHGCDLLILPEMFSTGFFTNDRETALSLAERNTQDTMAAMHRLADKYNTAIAGSFLASTASQLYNRAFLIEPNGDETFYDKRHLFRMAGENDLFNKGVTMAPVLRFRGWNMKLIVCYDLRFPTWCRNTFDKNGYDILLVIANWPKARLHPWNTLLAARAIENQCYVCASNRCGIDPDGIDYGSESSRIIDFKGQTCSNEIVTEIPTGRIISCTIDKEALDHFKKKFPAWEDKDSFELLL